MGSNKGNAMRAVIRVVIIKATRYGRRDIGDAMGITRLGITTLTSSTPSN